MVLERANGSLELRGDLIAPTDPEIGIGVVAGDDWQIGVSAVDGGLQFGYFPAALTSQRWARSSLRRPTECSATCEWWPTRSSANSPSSWATSSPCSASARPPDRWFPSPTSPSTATPAIPSAVSWRPVASIPAVAKDWSPSSWQSHTANQQPEWPDSGDLDRALKQISSYPPLVFAGEARSLQSSLAQVAAGNAFLLQAG